MLNTAVGVYLATRALYNYLYINNTTSEWSHLRDLPLRFAWSRMQLGVELIYPAAAAWTRTASWFAGIVASSVLFVQAGNRYYKGYASY